MAQNDYNIVALIPARSGSKRVPDKNIRPLAGHPLIAYTIAAALGSGIFSDVIVSTDSEHYAEIVKYYGAEVPFLRPAELAGDQSPDIEWLAITPLAACRRQVAVMTVSAFCDRPARFECRQPSKGHGRNFQPRPGSTHYGRWKNAPSIPGKCGWCGATA